MLYKSSFAFSAILHIFLGAFVVLAASNSVSPKSTVYEIQITSSEVKSVVRLKAKAPNSIYANKVVKSEVYADTSTKVNAAVNSKANTVVNSKVNTVVNSKANAQMGKIKDQAANELFFPSSSGVAGLVSQVEKNTQFEKRQQTVANSLEGRLKASGLDQVFGEASNQNWAHYQNVHERIDSRLNFDSQLAQYNHFGVVLVQFNLDDSGVLLLNSLKVKAQDPILKVHVLRAMHAALGEPLPQIKRNQVDADAAFHARFDFKRGNIQDNFTKQNKFGQPALYFVRTTEEKAIADSMAGQLADARLITNPFLITEKIEKYNRKKRRESLRFDPFESYRRDPFYLL